MAHGELIASQEEGVQAAVDRMQPSRQSDDEIAQLLQDARVKPAAASAQEAAFFAKHGCVSGHGLRLPQWLLKPGNTTEVTNPMHMLYTACITAL